jgi:hypothetical protein
MGDIISVDRLVDAVLERETGHLPQNKRNSAIGDRKLTNKAYGIGQVRKLALDDIREKYPKKYKNIRPQDFLGNESLSREAVKDYLNLIATKYLGDKEITTDNIEDVLYSYNAGPFKRGGKKTSKGGLSYAEDVASRYGIATLTDMLLLGA